MESQYVYIFKLRNGISVFIYLKWQMGLQHGQPRLETHKCKWVGVGDMTKILPWYEKFISLYNILSRYSYFWLNKVF